MASIPPVPLHPAYVAGILDGEGCFTISTRVRSISCSISVGMTDERVPQALHDQYGGSLYVKPLDPARRGKDIVDWNAAGAQRCLAVIADVWPYLVIKRAQAALVAMFATTVNKTGLNGVSESAMATRLRLMTLMREANRRGRGAVPLIVPGDVMYAAEAALLTPHLLPEQRMIQLRATILNLRARGVPWPEVARQLEYSVTGLAQLCRRLGLPWGCAERDIYPSDQG